MKNKFEFFIIFFIAFVISAGFWAIVLLNSQKYEVVTKKEIIINENLPSRHGGWRVMSVGI